MGRPTLFRKTTTMGSVMRSDDGDVYRVSASPSIAWVPPACIEDAPLEVECKEARLLELLKHPYGFLQFKRFADTAGCIPIPLFWQDVGMYASCPRALSRKFAAKIFRKYVTPTANLIHGLLSGPAVEAVEAQLGNDDNQDLPPTLFHKCLEEVLNHTADHIFSKFTLSPFNQRFVDFQARESTPVTLADFEIQRCLGKGGFGKVNAVTKRDTDQMYVLKQISKERVLRKRMVAEVMNERNILAQIHSPFLVNLNYAFQSDTDLYMCMDLMVGGDLDYQMCRLKKFDESMVQYYGAELVLGVGHLHDHNIVHRDIKPNNIMFDQDGHMRLTDMGLATNCAMGKWVKGRCGTPGFMAPEVMKKKESGHESDWFSLGIVLFIMSHGCHPFAHKKPEHRSAAILSEKVAPSKECSPALFDLLRGLTHRDPHKRLGHNGVAELQAHAFFEGVDWARTANRELRPPFTPDSKANVSGAFDFEEQFGQPEGRRCTIREEDQLLFADFDFVDSGAHRKEFFNAVRQFQIK